nr:hypothetical protein CFP56_65528 [Quercus suber]
MCRDRPVERYDWWGTTSRKCGIDLDMYTRSVLFLGDWQTHGSGSLMKVGQRPANIAYRPRWSYHDGIILLPRPSASAYDSGRNAPDRGRDQAYARADVFLCRADPLMSWDEGMFLGEDRLKGCRTIRDWDVLDSVPLLLPLQDSIDMMRH